MLLGEHLHRRNHRSYTKRGGKSVAKKWDNDIEDVLKMRSY